MGRQGRGGWTWRPRPLAEVQGSILKKLSAIARVRDRQKLDQGWIEDEAGNWIPPRWVRKPAGEGA